MLDLLLVRTLSCCYFLNVNTFLKIMFCISLSCLNTKTAISQKCIFHLQPFCTEVVKVEDTVLSEQGRGLKAYLVLHRQAPPVEFVTRGMLLV